MKSGNSFLQAVFRFVWIRLSDVRKKQHRNTAVLTIGVAAVTVVTFMASVYQGGSRNSLVAFAETHQETSQEEKETQGNKTEDKDRNENAGERRAEAGTQDIPVSTVTEQASEPEKQVPRTEGTVFGADKAKPVLRETKEEDKGKEAAEETGNSNVSEAVPVVACSANDYQVLLKIVQAEAGGCDMKGRILVANVILNRVKSGEFPDTITDVVFERSQFSPVSNGTIHTCRVTKETVNAVDRALAGEDYSQGALYFMNRGGSSGRNISWFDNNLKYLFKHENHEFFK